MAPLATSILVSRMSCELKGTNLQWLPPGAWKCTLDEASCGRDFSTAECPKINPEMERETKKIMNPETLNVAPTSAAKLPFSETSAVFYFSIFFKHVGLYKGLKR